MTLNIGVIGTGAIGRDHIRRITNTLSGARVTAVTDVQAKTAEETITTYGLDARALPTGQDVIAAPDVDAVLVTSWGPTHEEFVLASLAAGKPERRHCVRWHPLDEAEAISAKAPTSPDEFTPHEAGEAPGRANNVLPKMGVPPGTVLDQLFAKGATYAEADLGAARTAPEFRRVAGKVERGALLQREPKGPGSAH